MLLIKQNDAVYTEYMMFFSSIYQPYLMSINMKTYLSYTLFCSALAREQASRSQKRLRVKNEFLPRYCKMVTFTLNGNTHSLQGKNLFKEEHIHHILHICICIMYIYVNSDGDPKISQMTLAQYIREVALLTGTKVSCNEGGCGACIITVNKEGKSRSVNSVS